MVITDLKGHSGAPSRMAELADGRLASSSLFGDLQLWDYKDPDAEATIVADPSFDRDSIVQLDNGDLLGGNASEVDVRDPENNGIVIDTYTGHSRVITFVTKLRDGRIASGGRDDTVQVWHADRL